MAERFTATIDPNDPNNIIIESTDDGQEINTSYLQTNNGTGSSGNTAEASTTQEGSGQTVIWSTPVQDGTRGLTGNRGPGTFTRAVQLVRPTAALTQNLLSQGLTDGEVTEIFADFTSTTFNNSGTVEVGTNPIQLFTYTSKGAGDSSIIGPAGQFFTEVSAPATVSGFSDAPAIGTNETALVTIGVLDLTLTYNQIALQTICSDQQGSFTTGDNSCTIASGSAIAGDTAVITFLDSTELPGNTTTRAAIHDGTGILDDDWNEFELVIDGDLLVQGTVVAEALIIDGATLQSAPGGLGVLTVGRINAANINANAVTTEKLVAGAATFDKIDLNGQLQVNTDGSGAIAWGKNDAADVNSVGLFLGNENATNQLPRFVLGNSSSYIWFDGDELYVVGATNTSPNLEAQFYSTPGTFTYTISPTHSLLSLEMSGAGGGGGGNTGTAIAGESSTITVQKRTRINGVDTFATRFGELGGAVGGGLTQSYTAGTNTATVEVTTNEGFLAQGSIDLTTTGFEGSVEGAQSGGSNLLIDGLDNDTNGVIGALAITAPGSIFITGDSTNAQTFNFDRKIAVGNNFRLESDSDTINTHANGTIWTLGTSNGSFDYEDRRVVPQSSTELTAGVDGRTTQVTEIIVEDASAFPASGSISFSNGEIFNYTVIDTSGGTGLHRFVGNAQTLGLHSTNEVVESTTIVYSFFSSSAQDIGTHSTTVATTVRGDDHTFSASGGPAGASGSFVNAAGDGEAGDNFSAFEQSGSGNQLPFKGIGGTAGIFGPADGGNGGFGRGVLVNGATLDVSDGGGGGSATSAGANDGGEGGEDGTYVSVFGTGQGSGRYTIVSATDIIQVTIGNGGNGATGGTTSGGNGGDGAARITGS